MFFPKIMSRARAICERLFARDPASDKPITEIYFDFFKTVYRASMVIPLAKEPAAEKRNIYENKVPETNPCARILRRIKSRTSRFFNTESDSKTGKFVSPSLKNGKGLGIAYSTAERNMHSAVKKEMSRTLSSREL